MAKGSNILAVVAFFTGMWAAAIDAADDSRIATNRLRNAYFGDLHLHTAYSVDAYIYWGTRLGPDGAYRFARGESVEVMGERVRRRWPLDFAAVTDHAENLGVANQLDDPESVLSKSDLGKLLHDLTQNPLSEETHNQISKASHELMFGTQVPGAVAANHSAWAREIDAANQNYIPGTFTTFIAYEWTALAGKNRYNLHRNVIFSGDDAPSPFTSVDSSRPEALWGYMEAYRKSGRDVLAVPHNANASGGLMYDWNDSDGRPIDQAYALRRIGNEPLSEIGQIKGQSEVHPALSPNDEFANFEVYDHTLSNNLEKSEPHGSYIRDAYGRGLVIASKAGANPYKFGIEGGSDSHNALSASDENAYGGDSNGIDPNSQKEVKLAAAKVQSAIDSNDLKLPSVLDTGSPNLTGVWAEANTREAIFAALRRKETFATSGTRLKVRFFGGWDFKPAILKSGNWIQTAYNRGVPMGGDLPERPAATPAPCFLVWALKDPNGANLDRIQIIKVWLRNGAYEERILDVAYAGNRRPEPRTGKLSPIGNTVDAATGTYANTIGAAELTAAWQDSAFDPHEPAVYYVRVLEIPTPRWSTILASKAGLVLPPQVPRTIQERAWSSPIWYTPLKDPASIEHIPK